MPKQKDLKSVVRARMTKTGESYTAARAQVLKQKVVDFAALAGMKDASVEQRTGRDWRGWVNVLDRAGARSKPHAEIAKLLQEQHELGGWWAQMLTVGYERIRGLRDKGQRRGGGYDVGKSKTLPVSMERLWAAFEARQRRRWLGDAQYTVKRATPGKSLRIIWTDGTPLEFYFVKKGPEKSLVTLQHREQPTKARAAEVRAYWGERLAALAELLGV